VAVAGRSIVEERIRAFVARVGVEPDQTVVDGDVARLRWYWASGYHIAVEITPSGEGTYALTDRASGAPQRESMPLDALAERVRGMLMSAVLNG
jgi:hypothetical protein